MNKDVDNYRIVTVTYTDGSTESTTRTRYIDLVGVIVCVLNFDPKVSNFSVALRDGTVVYRQFRDKNNNWQWVGDYNGSEPTGVQAHESLGS